MSKNHSTFALPNRPRKCPEGFLFEYLKYAQGSESPEDFHIWTAIGILASAMGRNCFKDQGMWKIYPSLYVVLVAESALLHKSTALSIGKNLLQTSLPEDLFFFSQKVTPQSFIHFLSQVYEDTKASEAIIYASEFSVTLGNSKLDDSLLKILTDLYDCPDSWSYATIGRGLDRCDKVCLNMLAGTTPDWLKSSLPTESLGGGFFSRLILVNRFEPGPRVAHPKAHMTTEARVARENCLNDLQAIRANVQGEFDFDKEAYDMYEDWYNDHNDPMGCAPHLRGYYGRKPDTIIKLAMILSASKNDSKVITARDLESAVNLLNENEEFLTELQENLGQSEEGKKRERVLFLIKKFATKNQAVTHSKVLQNCSHQINAMQFRQIIDTLVEEGLVMIRKGVRGSNSYLFIG